MPAHRVDHVDGCDLQLLPEPWPYAAAHSGAIEAHWSHRLRENPGFFNGTIHIARSFSILDRQLRATMLRTGFKSFLHWREHGYPAAGVLDAFGSAIVRGSEGAVLLGRQRAGNINEGQAYLPGGFIDSRDVGADGRIDIAASIARELAEETKLDVAQFTVRPGFLIVQCGPLLSMCQELVSHQPAEALQATIRQNLAADPDPELADVVIIRAPADLAQHNVPAYTRLALAAIFERI